MKTLPFRWVFAGTTFVIGGLSGLLAAFGMHWYLPLEEKWTTILLIGGVFAALSLLIHGYLFRKWLLLPLEDAMKLANLSEPPPTAFHPHPTRIHELSELLRRLDANAAALRTLAETGQKVLEHGQQQDIRLHNEQDIIGKLFQRFFNIIQTAETHLNDMTQGNLDVRVRGTFGEAKLGKAFREMAQEMYQSHKDVRQEINHISRVSANIEAMSQQGSRNADIQAQEIRDVSDSIHQVAQQLRNVIHNISIQSNSLDDTFTAIEKMIRSIEQIYEGIHEMSSLSETTFGSIDEIHNFMQEIESHAQSSVEISGTVSDQAKEGLNSVGTVIEGIYTIKTTVENAADVIQRLGAESERIGEILEVINDVAEHTNLLALNASIIAAQAGEHGRGFSIVAEEIKLLATRTRTSTHEIEEIIRTVQHEVAQGMTAIQQCLKAVDHGVNLANQSGEVLKHIVRGIQASKKMVTTIARATATQTENSQQMKSSAQEVASKLEELQHIVSKQTNESVQMADVINFLRQLSQQIDQLTNTQLHETDVIVQGIEYIQKLVFRNSWMSQQLAQTSLELGDTESLLCEIMGRYIITERQLPLYFNPNTPTVALILQTSDLFFQQMLEGVINSPLTEQFQVINLRSQGDPVMQAEHVTWLLHQPWLKGILLTPVDQNTGNQLVTKLSTRGIPLVVLDFFLEHAEVSVMSDQAQGGKYAAEILAEHLPEESAVLVYGSRNLDSIARRMDGFLEHAKLYRWMLTEIFSVPHVRSAKKYLLDGLAVFPDASGIFLTNESLVLAYLELLKDGAIQDHTMSVVGFDMTPEIAAAIAAGELVGTVAQDAVRIGRTAALELMNMIKQPQAETLSLSKEKWIPVRKITKENLSNEFLT